MSFIKVSRRKWQILVVLQLICTGPNNEVLINAVLELKVTSMSECRIFQLQNYNYTTYHWKANLILDLFLITTYNHGQNILELYNILAQAHEPQIKAEVNI